MQIKQIKAPEMDVEASSQEPGHPEKGSAEPC